MSEKAFKPCPFCGSARIAKGERYFAMCVDCGATGPERNADATVGKFTKDWNTRAIPVETCDEFNARIRPMKEALGYYP